MNGKIQSSDPKKKVLFIVSKFPCYDEAFILRELDAFSNALNLKIFSLKGSEEKIVHEQARTLLPHTFYVPYFSGKVLLAQGPMFFRNPFKYLKALLQVILGNLTNPEFLFKGLVLFPKAIYVAQYALREKIDHIHAYWATYPTTVALVIHEITGIPFSFTGHAHDIYLSATHLKEKITKALFVTTCTKGNQNYLRQLTVKTESSKICLQHHGLRLEDFYVENKTRGNPFHVLSVGTLYEHKGFSYFIDALKILHDKKLSFKATIIGGGPLRSQLEQQIERAGLGKSISLVGALKQDEVIPYYKTADVFVLMAQSEWHWGIPNVIIEALAAKTAVITTRFGSVEELVQQDKTGLIVPAKESQSLAAALERLYHNDSLRMRFAMGGNQIVCREFDLSQTISDFTSRVTKQKAQTRNAFPAERKVFAGVKGDS